ncbi:hypothetical protein H4R34_001487 [Dimargaris verticillata]|uniref:DNA repair protein RAD51 homolog 3 n=1 Tax=Dimargaris verticillata TaxID=2761393 RepID=A0A9W8BAM8_9FUNG|nr:hypothetical protein H4R34_001487 [Dimargaris verticillata]
MVRPLTTYRLPPALVRQLRDAGYQTAQDLQQLSLAQVGQELSLSLSDITALDQALRASVPQPWSAQRVWDTASSLASIPTGSQALNSLFGSYGGVPYHLLTEVYGPPGIGKTQLAIQLCINAQRPLPACGHKIKAIYIDTEGSFVAQRAAQIARHAMHQWTQDAVTPGPMDESIITTLDDLLAGIIYIRVHSHPELMDTLAGLPGLIQTLGKVALVVIDSLTFPFRTDFDDMSVRSQQLTRTAQLTQALARDHALAVVLVNQMTTKFHAASSSLGQNSYLVPALGISWGHIPNFRVALSWEKGKR